MRYVLFLLLASLSLSCQGQGFKNLDKSPLDMVNYPASSRVQEKMVRVLYSRPQLDGRELSNLAPNDKVWRTGANESTEITFFKPATVGGKEVPAGRYTLYTIPHETTWTVIINKKVNTWGAYAYDENLDLLRVDVPVSQSEESLEAFSMTIEGNGGEAQLKMGWGKIRASLPMTF